MKAAVIYQNGLLGLADFPEPVVQNEEEVLITMRAAAIKHFDRSRAGGKHYSSEPDMENAKVIGSDGIGFLSDGTRVYAVGVSGMVAEKAVAEKARMVRVPEGLDDATAAALPNAVAGSATALHFRAGIKTGETVLINGATGFTGKIAVQVAKYYGAKKIIVTGRNEQSLDFLRMRGEDETVSINQTDENFIAQIKQIHIDNPIDIIIDYLWGHTAELILAALKGNGSCTHQTRFISVGAVTGNTIQLSAENLRSVNLQLSGSGIGSWTKNELQKLFSEIIPEMFTLAAENKIKADTVKISLDDIDKLTAIEVPPGKRLVVMIGK